MEPEESNFALWLKTALANESFCYHFGNLIADRFYDAKLDQQATEVWEAYENGFVNLVQERASSSEALYWAIRSSTQI